MQQLGPRRGGVQPPLRALIERSHERDDAALEETVACESRRALSAGERDGAFRRCTASAARISQAARFKRGDRLFSTPLTERE